MLNTLSRTLKTWLSLPLLAVTAAEETSANEDEELVIAPITVSEEKRRVRFTGTYTLFESPALNPDTVTSWFTAKGYWPQAPLKGGGGGGMFTLGKVVMEGSGKGLSAETHDGADLGYGMGQGTLGYVLVDTGFLRIYPLIGGSGSGGSVDKPEAAASDNGDGAVEEKLATGAARVSFGLGIDLTFKIWKLGLLVGLRLGYAVKVGDADSPEPASGPFARFVIGPSF